MSKSVLFVFFCLMALRSCTRARPDLSLGYRYNQGHSSGGGLLLQAPGSATTPYNPTASTYSYFASQPSVGQADSSGYLSSSQSNNQINSDGFGQQYTNLASGFGGGLGGVASFNGIGGSSFNAGFGGRSTYNSGTFAQTQEGEQQHFSTPIVSKHFYIHSIPPDNDEEEIVRHVQVGQPQKNYRVVFINTPSAHTAKAKIIADIAPTEEKTAIYVLAKKNNDLDISAEVNTPAPTNNKPEVFFIKYKTPEEAVHAQHTIQAQYDALGGTSDISNEDHTSVQSVVGTFPHSNNGNDLSTSSTSSDGTAAAAIQQTYLPANQKFKYK